jgi:hypothetical protein
MSRFVTRHSTQAAVLLLGTVVMGGDRAPAQQVFPSDVLIQGSLCTGFDCAPPVSFGFDTIILRENNLRILFDDTSTAAGFPNNKWRLTANDSASGGASHFTIEDATAARQVFRANAGARANSLVIGSNGRVGFGTATPVLVAHALLGDTPGMRLEQDGSSGFTPQTWDVSGNEANFFVRDVTGGSRLPFRIRPGAPTSSLDISASGNVGIGTASPQENVHVTSSGNTGIRIETTGTSAAKWSVALVGNTGVLVLRDQNAGTSPLRIRPGAPTSSIEIGQTGNVGIGTSSPAAALHVVGAVRLAGVTNCGSGIVSNANGDLSCLLSSRQFKNVTGNLSADVALANVMALRPQVGAYKATPDEMEHWLIAEDVAAVDGALVGLRDGKPYTVKTHGIVADLVAVIQQQQRRIEALERAIAR